MTKFTGEPSLNQTFGEPFEIDLDLLDNKYNEVRKPSLPYGIVINSEPAGIFIPKEQLIKAEWHNLPNEQELSTVELTEEVKGILLTKCKIIILAFVSEYVRWKDIEQNGEKAGTFIALYENYRHYLDKKTQDVCSEHALVFLDSKNQPSHKLPIVVRFKNVSLWSFKSAREEFYRTLEKVFAEYSGQPYSGKSNKWRSLGVLNVEFRGIKEGEGKNKSVCCKTYKITSPTLNNLPKLFLGETNKKEQIWRFHKSIAGFIEGSNEQLLRLSATTESEVQILSAADGNGENYRQINQEDSEFEDFDNLDW